MSQKSNNSSTCCPKPRTVVEIGNANRVLRGKIPIGRGKTVELIGRSWAADSTAFVVPSLNLALDAGYPVHGKRMNSVFVTHAHTDHIHHITHLKSRAKPPSIYLPTQVVSKTENFIDVAQQLTSNLSP